MILRVATLNHFQNQIKTTLVTQRLRLLCTEIYKTLIQLNLEFMSNIFKLSYSNKAACKQQVLSHKTKPG